MLERIGHYKIVEELGRGGMGTVYKAHEESLNRSVAIKVLGEHLSHDPEYVKRFLREARSAAALSHPNIVQIYFIGEEDGRHYFVMEYVRGRSLHEILKAEGPIDVERSVRYLREAASGLAEAHDHGVIHRDIKPANLMIDRADRLKIADFGLALVPGEAATKLTATGTFMGTPGYLSPEQCLGEEVDHRSDIYSLGITWYELLTGEMPFSADSPAAVLVRVVQVEPPPVESLRPEVDERLRAILRKMIAKERGSRYADAHELEADLEAYAAGVAPPVATTGGPTVRMDDAQAAAPPVPPPGPPGPPSLPAGAPPEPPPREASEAPPPLTDYGRESRSSASPVLWALLILLLLAGGGLALAWQMEWIGASSTDDVAEVDGETAKSEDRRGSGMDAVEDGDGDDGDGTVRVEEDSKEFPGVVEAEDAVSVPSGDDAERDGQDGRGSPTVEYERESGSVESLGSAGGSRAADRRVDDAQAGRERIRLPGPAGETDTNDRRVVDEGSNREPPPPPKPRGRGTAVVALGEPLLAGEVERALESRLSNAGVELFDEKGSPSASSLFRRADENLDLRTAMDALETDARYLVLARVDYLGERELTYLGRRDLEYQARVTVTTVDLFTGDSLGSVETEKLGYTQLTAEDVASEALRDIAFDLADRLP